MEFFIGILIAVLMILMLPTLRLVTTFVHEIGHAIPALILTDKPVTVYLGSYGDISKSLKINLGRLVLYLRFNIFNWKLGMCAHSPPKQDWKSFLIIFGGPFASLLIVIFGGFLLYNTAWSNNVIFFISAMMLLGIIDFVVNIYPRKYSYEMHDGSLLMSDGTQLRLLWQKRKYSPEFFALADMVAKEDGEERKEAILKIKEYLKNNSPQKEYFFLLIDAYTKEEEFEKVITTYEDYVDHYALDLLDYKTIGKAYIKIKNYQEAIRCLNEYIHTNFRDSEAVYNRGVALMNTEHNLEAIKDFDAAIHYQYPDIAKPLTHKAAILLKLNDKEEAERHLELAIKYGNGEDNPELALTYARLYEAKAEYPQALEHYEKAKKLGSDYHGLEYKIYQMEEWIQKRSL